MASNYLPKYESRITTPRSVIVSGTISLQNGSPTILEGTGQFTIADTATGKTTVTFTEYYSGCVSLVAQRMTDSASTVGHYVIIRDKKFTSGILSFILENASAVGATATPADAADNANEQISFIAVMRL